MRASLCLAVALLAACKANAPKDPVKQACFRAGDQDTVVDAVTSGQSNPLTVGTAAGVHIDPTDQSFLTFDAGGGVLWIFDDTPDLLVGLDGTDVALPDAVPKSCVTIRGPTSS